MKETKIKEEGLTPQRTEQRPTCLSERNPSIMVLGGGGSKIVAMLGALKAIETRVPDFLHQVQMWVGTSAGAILSLLFCCRYTVRQLEGELTYLNMSSLLSFDITSLLVGKGMGLDSGERYLEWISEKMAAKGIHPMITLSQLKELTGLSLITVASDLHTRSSYFFSADSDPDIPAIMAVRASFGIPIWFTSISYKNMILLDGGLTLNCAFYTVVESYADQNNDVVFGIDLNFTEAAGNVENLSLIEYVSLLGEMFVSLQNGTSAVSTSVQSGHHRIHYVPLSKHYPLLVVSEEEKQKLFQEGFESIQ